MYGTSASQAAFLVTLCVKVGCRIQVLNGKVLIYITTLYTILNILEHNLR